MKHNKYLLFLAAVLCLSFVSCSNTNVGELSTANKRIASFNEIATETAVSKSPVASGLREQEFIPSRENVKLLGRTYLLGDTLWLSYSASGIEFTVTGTKVVLTLKGDNIAASKQNERRYCRIGIYVNDELISDELLKERKKAITAFESDNPRTVTIKVLKLSETTNSTVGIGKIKVTSADSVNPTPPKAHKIEFIGDSITCGFGVDDSNVNNPFTTATEDVTKTYAYKTAKALDSDYSMVAISGYGILSGHTKNGVLNTNQLLPKYYDKMGFSYGYFNNTIKVDTLDWDFTEFVPDLIVINLGSNDHSYCGNDKEKQADFTKSYISFLKQVREKNTNAVILCTLGMMGDTLYPCVEDAVQSYSKDTGDTNVYSYQFDVQQSSDGYGACWHPSEKTHSKAAEKLTDEIKRITGW